MSQPRPDVNITPLIDVLLVLIVIFMATNKTMFIAGAPSLRYGAIVRVIDAAKGAGVDRVGIITEGARKRS
jgi:biopolymer transport protein ExbD